MRSARLEAGKAADIIAIDISGPGYSETPDVETLLVYSGSGRDRPPRLGGRGAVGARPAN